MAARWEDDQQGYDVSRFQVEVSEDLLCSICQEVLIFCFSHKARHLVQNSETCPVCRDTLTQENFRRPTGFLKNQGEGQKIKRDHHDRGCSDYVRLEHLLRHDEECGYASVMCRNEECGTEVNKRDNEIHEKDLCQLSISNCHNCKDINVSQNEKCVIISDF